MTDKQQPVSRRNFLPLRLFSEGVDGDLRFDADEAGIPNKCVWKCAGACYHEAPNESNAQDNSFADIMKRRFGRRTLIKGAAAATVPLVVSATPMGDALLGDNPLSPRVASAQTAGSTGVKGTNLGFKPITLTREDREQLPEGYSRKILLRWGDPLFPGVPRLTMANATAQLQEQTFGYNCDLNIWFSMSSPARDTRGLLWVNHEYTEGARMFPSYDPANPTKAQVDVELAAHGGTVVELKKTGKEWEVVLDSPYNKRYSALSSVFEISGPLRGHDLLKTTADPEGVRVIGTLNNCAGGPTPWGTVLSGEENWNQYFANNDGNPNATLQAMNKRYGVGGGASSRSWEKYHSRFDLSKEPNEINRFGYIVEIDPMDPDWTPRKRTAMGRFKHEGANYSICADGRVAFYSGDDERFDYQYKFVTKNAWDPNDREAARTLLDEGDLYVARFRDDGTGTWIKLAPTNGSLRDWTMEDILLNTRGAADAAGATPMDRPEDVEVNPRNHRVYIACTNNTRRTAEQVDGPNPRPDNAAGHIIELSEDRGDAAATEFTWEMFMLCGRADDPSTFFAGFDKTQVSSIGAPDNVAFDRTGNLWIATDGMQNTPVAVNDGLFAVPTAGPNRGKLQAFYNCPKGAEVCGPYFTDDNRAVFLNIQHPGENSEGPDDPETLWPDNEWPPLPSLIVITKDNGGIIGS